MTYDAMTAGKAELEERDRRKALAAEARIALASEEPYQDSARHLMRHGFSWAEAFDALEYIAWEDNRHDGESDP